MGVFNEKRKFYLKIDILSSLFIKNYPLPLKIREDL